LGFKGLRLGYFDRITDGTQFQNDRQDCVRTMKPIHYKAGQNRTVYILHEKHDINNNNNSNNHALMLQQKLKEKE
jgi:hypothetical protein